MFFLLIFEFLSTQELLLILVAALVLFGPRKLPQLARSVGKSLSEFKRASEDFKEQWEREVERETADLREGVNSLNDGVAASWDSVAASGADWVPPPVTSGTTINDAAATPALSPAPLRPASATVPAPPTRKQDWL